MKLKNNENNVFSRSLWKDAWRLVKKVRKDSRKGTRRSLLAWDLTIVAPGGSKPPAEDEAGVEGVVVVGQGEWELAFGS